MRPRTVLLLSSLVLLAGLVLLLRARMSVTSVKVGPAPAPGAPQVSRRQAAKRVAVAPMAVEAPSPAAQQAQGRLVLELGWGAGPGQVGQRGGEEANPEAPMGLTVDDLGNLLILDQVNGRVQRFGPGGEVLSSVLLRSKTAQDLLVTRDGKTVVLDRLGQEPALEVHPPGGGTPSTVPLVGGPIKEGGAVTGVFADEGGIYAEDQHDDLVRVATSAGAPAPSRDRVPGRPTRDGKLFVKAGIIDRASGRLYVQAHRKDRALAWETPVTVTLPALHILLLDSDLKGNIYLGVEVGREAPGTHALTDLATVAVRLDSAGKVNGSLTLPPTTEDPAETFRPLAVGNDGTIYHMVAGNEGITVRVYRFQ